MAPHRLAALGIVGLLAAACSSGGGATSAPTDATATPTEGAVATPEATVDVCANPPTMTAGKLTVGADNPAYPPFYIPDDQPPEGSEWELGQPTNGKGLESATAYAIAERLGFAREDVVWVVAPFNTVIQPGDKSFDMYLTQVSYSDERAEVVDLSDGYFDLNQAVVALAGTPIANVTTVAGLKDFKLGAQVGTTSYQYIVDHIQPNVEPNVYDTNDAAIQALQAGQIAGIVADLPTTFYMRDAQLTDGTIVGSLPTAAGEEIEHFSVLLEKDSPLTACVNRAIQELKDDGSLDLIRNEWIGGSGAPELQ
ncbi:MAG TPA: ABC transporter substrate-binding protein [Candidatus Binatia bacterium]|nr:ABC transporter substrate-binding protein [Candidatus Binatia bacterium]